VTATLGPALGLSSFVLASPVSDADLGLFGKVRSFGYDQVEVCVEDPAQLLHAAYSSDARGQPEAG
jgi:hypothetical protein